MKKEHVLVIRCDKNLMNYLSKAVSSRKGLSTIARKVLEDVMYHVSEEDLKGVVDGYRRLKVDK